MWSPESDDERFVMAQVDRLADLVIEGEPPSDLVYGVGSLTWRGELAPLLIVDRRLDRRRENPTRVGGLFFGRLLSRLMYDLVGPLWPLSYVGVAEREPRDFKLGGWTLALRALTSVLLRSAPRPREWVYASAADAGEKFQAKFREWELPTNLVILFAPPPRSISAMGVAQVGRRRFGTIGLEGVVNGQFAGFTTAGHVVDSSDAIVSRAKRWLLWILRLGDRENVVLYTDPIEGLPGYDLAVVGHLPGAVRSFDAEGETINDASAVKDRALCRLAGAVSGCRWGLVDARLRIEKDREGRLWENCWAVTGQSGWFCREGDSGGLVTMRDGRILGILVGGLAIGGWLSGDRKEIGFVQDLESTIKYVKSEFHFDIRVRP